MFNPVIIFGMSLGMPYFTLLTISITVKYNKTHKGAQSISQIGLMLSVSGWISPLPHQRQIDLKNKLFKTS